MQKDIISILDLMLFLCTLIKVKGKLRAPPFTVIGGGHTPKKVKEP